MGNFIFFIKFFLSIEIATADTSDMKRFRRIISGASPGGDAFPAGWRIGVGGLKVRLRIPKRG